MKSGLASTAQPVNVQGGRERESERKGKQVNMKFKLQ